MRFSIILNYNIILTPESTHVLSFIQFVLLHYGIVYQLLQYCQVVYALLGNISLCSKAMCDENFRDFNLFFISLSIVFYSFA